MGSSSGPVDLPPVRQFGKYEILGTLGRGGMATAYRARLSTLGDATRLVAIKMIHSHLIEDEEHVLMFLDEVRLAMALTHRNIVQTFDAGRSEEHHYLVMELVEGATLRRLIGSVPPGQQLPLEIVLFIGMEVCAALDYAHNFRSPTTGRSSPVIHRDVSPGNILLSLDGDVKLADFGVAKALGRLAVSMVNQIKGKWSYMAPEQARGEAVPRSDLFAMGAVLYEMISGHPIRGKKDLLQVAAGNDEIVPLARLRPDVPAAVGELVTRALSANHEQRPASAGEMRDVLVRALLQFQLAGKGVDAHGRLRSFLAQLRVNTTAASEQVITADRVAQAMLLVVQRLDQRSPGPPVTVDAEATTKILASPGGPTVEPHTAPALHERSTVTGPTTSRCAPPSTANGAQAQAAELPTTVVTDRGAEQETAQVRSRWHPHAATVAVTAAVTLVALVTWWSLIRSDALHDPAPRAARDVGRAPSRQVGLKTGAAPVRVLPLPAPDGGVVEIGHALRVRLPANPKVAAPARPVYGGSAPADLVRVKLRVQPGKQRIRPRVARPRFGWLDVNSRPWAHVYIDGVRQGTTPRQNLALPVGPHQLRLVSPSKGLVRTLTITIRPSQTLRMAIVLQ